LSLSDYIAPESSGITDNIGAFVVTVGTGDSPSDKYGDDDYASLMIRLIADRLAEAATEYLHREIRRNYWGYAREEELSIDKLFKGRYRGIRPAPGYPACPDHSEKRVIFDLLDAERLTGAGLTGNFAMTPPSSVCGYLFAHPGSAYFNIGKIGKDQLKDYSERKNITLEEAEKWLSSNLQ
jgi:5-methyltetrahydrofolate--homocysteine methyltransferase